MNLLVAETLNSLRGVKRVKLIEAKMCVNVSMNDAVEC